MSENPLDRTIQFIGKEAQARLRTLRVAIVGVGGLGTHITQQLAFFRVGQLALIDSEELKKTSLNRYVGVRHNDPIPGTRKVDLGERLVTSIDPSIQVQKVFDSLVSEAAFEAIIAADYVFGCLDNEGSRLILTELCAAYERPYFDLASDILPGDVASYGGQVCVAWDGASCLVCLGVLDLGEAQRELANPELKRDIETIYGVRRSDVDEGGPSVVSINGVVASLATTEFLVGVAGLRRPAQLLTYRGNRGTVTARAEPPSPGCYYCKGIRGRRAEADVQRYLRDGVGKWIR